VANARYKSSASRVARAEATSDTVLAYWTEHRAQFRQSENQRAILTNYVLVIAAGASGFVIQQRFSVRTIPLSVLIIAIGLYGALAVAKYHERATYHLLQARALTQVLVDMGALDDHDALLDKYRREHYLHYPVLRRLRLYQLWIAFHLGIAVYGVALIVITIAAH
jgi:hypothetical protein